MLEKLVFNDVDISEELVEEIKKMELFQDFHDSSMTLEEFKKMVDGFNEYLSKTMNALEIAETIKRGIEEDFTGFIPAVVIGFGIKDEEYKHVSTLTYKEKVVLPTLSNGVKGVGLHLEKIIKELYSKIDDCSIEERVIDVFNLLALMRTVNEHETSIDYSDNINWIISTMVDEKTLKEINSIDKLQTYFESNIAIINSKVFGSKGEINIDHSVLMGALFRIKDNELENNLTSFMEDENANLLKFGVVGSLHSLRDYRDKEINIEFNKKLKNIGIDIEYLDYTTNYNTMHDEILKSFKVKGLCDYSKIVNKFLTTTNEKVKPIQMYLIAYAVAISIDNSK